MRKGDSVNKYIITSESVTEGHPDKLCDQISDSILDAYLDLDGNSRVAVETMISNKLLIIAGEITSNVKVDIEEIAKETIKEIGYINDEDGYNFDKSIVITNIVEQSSDISRGVNKKEICAGDQGIVFGYACNETKNYMPYPIEMANRLARRLAYVRKNNIVTGLKPDGKTQVSVIYENGKVVGIDSIVIAAQHQKNALNLKENIMNKVILNEIDNNLISDSTKIYINYTGNFVKGGPSADSGLTGRKLIVDTYGGIGRHGGGAFSGKDPSKADRSGAYMARYVAKNIVAAGLADKCEVGLSFVIGKKEANSIEINTFGTEKYDMSKIYDLVINTFNFSIDYIIKKFKLQRPIYKNLAAYGHFGRDDDIYLWEKTDCAIYLKKRIGELN